MNKIITHTAFKAQTNLTGNQWMNTVVNTQGETDVSLIGGPVGVGHARGVGPRDE